MRRRPIGKSDRIDVETLKTGLVEYLNHYGVSAFSQCTLPSLCSNYEEEELRIPKDVSVDVFLPGFCPIVVLLTIEGNTFDQKDEVRRSLGRNTKFFCVTDDLPSVGVEAGGFKIRSVTEEELAICGNEIMDFRKTNSARLYAAARMLIRSHDRDDVIYEYHKNLLDDITSLKGELTECVDEDRIYNLKNEIAEKELCIDRAQPPKVLQAYEDLENRLRQEYCEQSAKGPIRHQVKSRYWCEELRSLWISLSTFCPCIRYEARLAMLALFEQVLFFWAHQKYDVAIWASGKAAEQAVYSLGHCLYVGLEPNIVDQTNTLCQKTGQLQKVLIRWLLSMNKDKKSFAEAFDRLCGLQRLVAETILRLGNRTLRADTKNSIPRNAHQILPDIIRATVGQKAAKSINSEIQRLFSRVMSKRNSVAHAHTRFELDNTLPVVSASEAQGVFENLSRLIFRLSYLFQERCVNAICK